MSPAAVVRISITEDMLEHFGGLSSEAFRELRAWLWDIPAAARVHIDLGPIRVVDWFLVGELRTKPYASGVVFESRDWRLAEHYAMRLAKALSEAPTR